MPRHQPEGSYMQMMVSLTKCTCLCVCMHSFFLNYLFSRLCLLVTHSLILSHSICPVFLLSYKFTSPFCVFYGSVFLTVYTVAQLPLPFHLWDSATAKCCSYSIELFHFVKKLQAVSFFKSCKNHFVRGDINYLDKRCLTSSTLIVPWVSHSHKRG